MVQNYVKNTLILALVCLGLFSQTQGMQQLKRILGTNLASKTRLFRPALNKLGNSKHTNPIRYHASGQSWIKQIAKWTMGATLTTTATAGVAAHYIHNLPDKKRYPIVSTILDYKPIQKVLTWFPNFGRKLASYWKTNGAVEPIEQEIKKRNIDPKIKLECINKWPKECQDGCISDMHILICKPYIQKGPRVILDKLSQKDISITIDNLLQEERINKHNGYYSFYHGCNKVNYASMLIDSKINEVLSGKKYHFPLLRSHISLRSKIINFFFRPDDQRNNFLQNGTSNDHSNRDYLLSVNAALIGNISNLRTGECTLGYFMANANNYMQGNPMPKYRTIFNGKYYEEIKSLYDFYNNNIRGGILLQIGIKKPLLDKCTYSAHPFGKKKSVCINNKEISTPSEILDMVQNNPTSLDPKTIDDLQFRLILTQDMLLNPHDEEIAKNFKIKAWSFDQEKLEEFHKKIDQLMERIKQDMQISCTITYQNGK